MTKKTRISFSSLTFDEKKPDSSNNNQKMGKGNRIEQRKGGLRKKNTKRTLEGVYSEYLFAKKYQKD